MVSYHLDIYVSDHSLVNLYDEAIAKHNAASCSPHPDSGFDLLVPTDTFQTMLDAGTSGAKAGVVPTVCADLGVKIAMRKFDCGTPTGCYLYARSSCSKYPFRLANNQGIIDSGYRGSVKAMMDVNWNIASFLAPHSNTQRSPAEYRSLLEGLEQRDFAAYPELSHGASTPIRLMQICAPGLEAFSVTRVSSSDQLGTTQRGEGGIGSTGL